MLLFFNSSISPSFVFLMLYYVLENRRLVLLPAAIALKKTARSAIRPQSKQGCPQLLPGATAPWPAMSRLHGTPSRMPPPGLSHPQYETLWSEPAPPCCPVKIIAAAVTAPIPPACSLIATPMAVVTLFGSTDIVITLSMPNR